MSFRILNAEPNGYSEEARRILQGIGDLVEKSVSQEELAEAAASFDVLIVRLGLQVSRQVIESASRLRVIVSATTGLDHIDLEAAGERDAAVLSLRGEQEFLRSVHSTAEHTWALLLALVRRIPWAFEDVKKGKWRRDKFRGVELSGGRLGILGLGRLGEQVARYGQAFGMEVGAYDPYRKGWMEPVRRFDSLEDFLAWSRICSVHVPLNDETNGLLNGERLRQLPKGALVVNTTRGGVIEEASLVRLLEENHLGGAAVDVLAEEHSDSLRESSPLLRYAVDHENVVITPHLGGATFDAMQRTEVFMAKKLQRFLASAPDLIKV